MVYWGNKIRVLLALFSLPKLFTDLCISGILGESLESLCWELHWLPQLPNEFHSKRLSLPYTLRVKRCTLIHV